MDSVIFDLDGTLWDATYTYADAWNTVLLRLGVKDLTMDHTDIKRTAGLPYDQVFDTLLKGTEEDLKNRIAIDCEKEAVQLLSQKGGLLFPGVDQGLRRLRKKFPLFIVSNCSAGYIETFLDCSKLHEVFEDFESYGRSGLLKSENIQLVMKRNGLKAPVYVGDTRGDQIAAKRANVRYIHVDYGFGEPEGKCESHATFSSLVEKLLNEES